MLHFNLNRKFIIIIIHCLVLFLKPNYEEKIVYIYIYVLIKHSRGDLNVCLSHFPTKTNWLCNWIKTSLSINIIKCKCGNNLTLVRSRVLWRSEGIYPHCRAVNSVMIATHTLIHWAHLILFLKCIIVPETILDFWNVIDQIINAVLYC